MRLEYRALARCTYATAFGSSRPPVLEVLHIIDCTARRPASASRSRYLGFLLQCLFIWMRFEMLKMEPLQDDMKTDRPRSTYIQDAMYYQRCEAETFQLVVSSLESSSLCKKDYSFFKILLG
jgi:hypothetical protein